MLRPTTLGGQGTLGYCGMPENPVVAKMMLHTWEEPCLSGTRGSGAVFFSGCNLRCAYCQNSQISHGGFGKELTIDSLRQGMKSLLAQGAHNLNLVTPSHFTRTIGCALDGWRPPKPVVYNSGGYDSVESLTELDGMIDIYLPDLKYIDGETANLYSGAKDYFSVASAALTEMHRQVGPPIVDRDGLMISGLMVRHLVLPGQHKASVRILQWVRDNLPGAWISLMCQYIPRHLACKHPALNRRITRYEYDKVLNALHDFGLTQGYTQERTAAKADYIPDFDLQGVP